MIVSGLFALLEIGVSLSLFISPEAVVDIVDLKAAGVDYLIQMWAVRQFALGFIFGVATFKKSIPMLTIAYVLFLVIMTGELLVGVVHDDNPFIIGAMVMSAVSSALLFR